MAAQVTEQLVEFLAETMNNARLSHRVRRQAAERLDGILARQMEAEERSARRRERAEQRAEAARAAELHREQVEAAQLQRQQAEAAEAEAKAAEAAGLRSAFNGVLQPKECHEHTA